MEYSIIIIRKGNMKNAQRSIERGRMRPNKTEWDKSVCWSNPHASTKPHSLWPTSSITACPGCLSLSLQHRLGSDLLYFHTTERTMHRIHSTTATLPNESEWIILCMVLNTFTPIHMHDPWLGWMFFGWGKLRPTFNPWWWKKKQTWKMVQWTRKQK